MKPLRLNCCLWLAMATSVALGPDRLAPAAEPAPAGYANYETYCGQVRAIARSKLVKLHSLARTLGGREVFCLEIGTGKTDQKPAILVVGGVHPPQLLGSELAVRVARQLAQRASSDKQAAAMLDRVTFYVIPRPSPDPCEALFRKPYVERAENDRPMDDDGDGAVDEDGPDDLDGDGWITTMRVEDPAGPYMPHPEDPRALVKADPVKDQKGRWSLFVEGRDNDQDGEQNEDPPGGAAFNRNFTFRYPYFQRGAGPHQVSEPETRAVADFAFSHPNIALVLSFTPEDNLMRPWKPGAQAESAKAKTAVSAADAGYLDYFAGQYRTIHGGTDCPESPDGQGSFSEWAYFHFGRWSLACRGWWVPKIEPAGAKAGAKAEAKPAGKKPEEPKAEPKPAAAKPRLKPGKDNGKDNGKENGNGNGNGESKGAAGEKPEKPENPEKPAAKRGRSPAREAKGKRPDDKAPEPKTPQARPAQELRGADDVNALRWLDREKLDGFVPWRRIEHPDFPGRVVEVGGFKPLVRLNPPARELEPLAEKHGRFLRRVVELLPELAIHQTKAEPLGAGVWRITVTAVNLGYLPTVSQMGSTTGEPHPLQAALELPQGVRLLTGHPRTRLPTLPGRGGKAEVTWLVSAPQGKEHRLAVRVWSPSVGDCRKAIVLSAQPDAREKKP